MQCSRNQGDKAARQLTWLTNEQQSLIKFVTNFSDTNLAGWLAGWQTKTIIFEVIFTADTAVAKYAN